MGRNVLAEVIAALPAVRARWVASAVSTEPADRTAAEDAVRRALAAAGDGQPRHIHWLASPYAVQVKHALDDTAHGWPVRSRAASRFSDLFFRLWRSASRRWSNHLWRVPRHVGRPYAQAYRADVRSPQWVWWLTHEAGAPTTTERAIAAEVASAMGYAPPREALFRRMHAMSPDPGEAWPLWRWDRFTPVFVGSTLADLDAIREIEPDVKLLDPYIAVALSCYGWWGTPGPMVLVDRPQTMLRDGAGRLHCADGPALRFRDGYEVYAWRGHVVPPHIITARGEVTIDAIRRTANIERRRVLMEVHAHVHGPGELLSALDARLVNEDICNGRPRRLYRIEDRLYLKVVNGTLDADGTQREYLLGARPGSRTAKQAVASSYGLSTTHYREAVRT